MSGRILTNNKYFWINPRQDKKTNGVITSAYFKTNKNMTQKGGENK